MIPPPFLAPGRSIAIRLPSMIFVCCTSSSSSSSLFVFLFFSQLIIIIRTTNRHQIEKGGGNLEPIAIEHTKIDLRFLFYPYISKAKEIHTKHKENAGKAATTTPTNQQDTLAVQSVLALLNLAVGLCQNPLPFAPYIYTTASRLYRIELFCDTPPPIGFDHAAGAAGEQPEPPARDGVALQLLGVQPRFRQRWNGWRESYSRLTITSMHSSAAPSPASYRRRSMAYSQTRAAEDDPSQAMRLASHIWGGQISHDSYRKMLDRVRQQFRKPQMHGHDPLIFPPLIPSASRPHEPEVPKFSRGIRLLHGGLAGIPTTAASRRPSETPMDDGEGTRTMSETASLPAMDATTASLPICDLGGLDDKVHRLTELEQLERGRLEATEKWDRNVVNEMMVVHYVTYVLKPEMEEVQAKERFVRGMIRYDEEKEWYYLYNESPTAQIIHTETRALLEREAKMARLSRLETEYQEKKQPTSARNNTTTTNSGMRSGFTFGMGARAPAKKMEDVNVVETSKLPDQVQEARTILQRYVREKLNSLSEGSGPPVTHPYTPNTARRLSSLPLPPISAAPRRNTLGVADYITLLDEDDQYRALIESAEYDERRDIERLMREDYMAVMDWQRKNMHLQRLQYWRDEREANLLKELDQISCTVGFSWPQEALDAFEAHAAEETVQRHTIESNEGAEWTALMEATKLGADCDAQRVMMEKAIHSKGPIRSFYYRGLMEIAMDEEASARADHVRARDAFIRDVVAPKAEVLKMLYKITVRPRFFRAVLTIQRTYYKYKQGMIGYRRTHRKIGQDIQTKRLEEDVQRGRKVFDGYRQLIQTEIDAIDKAALDEFIAQSRRLLQEESQERLIFDSKEAMTFSSIKRTFVKELRDGILGGRIQRLFRQELEERTEREVKEQLDFSAIRTYSKTLATLILAREETVREQDRERARLQQLETETIRSLLSNEYDRREEIRIDAEAEAERLRQECARYARQLVAERGATEAEMLGEHFLYINKLQQRGTTKRALELLFYRDAFTETTSNIVQSWADWAVECHAVLGWVDCLAHQDLIHVREVELHEENEKLTRRAGEREEDDAFYEIQKSYRQMLEDTKEKLSEEQRAVRLLCGTWRKYKSGDLGRSATRKYLHEAFRPKREKLEIARRNAENRKHINAVRGELEKEEEKHRRETVASVEMKMAVLVTKTEPRARWDVADKEDMIFTILRNNFYSAGIRAFDPRNKMALLWQKESYERVMIKKEWRRAFAVEFEPKKATFREDIMIRPIQRAWRAYVQRRELKKMHTAEQDVIAQAELSDRFYIMQREAVIYRDLYHSLMEEEWEAGLLYGISPGSVEDQQATAFASLVQQEWNARANLLWDMRYDLCDGYLSTSEFRARQFLIREEFLSGKQQAELRDEETLTRQLLMQERGLFLLRMMCKQERAHRETIRDEAQQGTEVQWLLINEELAREVVLDEYCDFWRRCIYEPLAEITAQQVASEERVARFWTNFLAEESAARCELVEDEIVGRQRQVMLMERMLRGLIHTNEQFEREGSVTLCWTEEKERMDLILAWARGLHYGPSSFAPHLVYERMPVYVRCIEEAEVLVREYLESSERAAAELLFTHMSYLQEEYAMRNELKAEEKVVREQRVVVLEEQQDRSEIISEWARGVRYVPSSFSPEIVNQRLHVFLGGVEQTEAISRDYIVLAEEVAFRSMRREKMCLDYEQHERAALTRLERHELQRDLLMQQEESNRKKMVDAFQKGLFYAPSDFAPTMVAEEIPLYIRCITDAEELVRHRIDNDEFNMRAFHRREMAEQEAYAMENDAFQRKLREQRKAVCREERAGRKAIWRDTFEFVRREDADAETDSEEELPYQERGTDTVLDAEELALPPPLPPMIIENARYVTYTLSRKHVWHKYVYGLQKICRRFFPSRPVPEFDEAPLDGDFTDSSDEDDDEEEDLPNRKKTLMLLRGEEEDPATLPEYKFRREDPDPAMLASTNPFPDSVERAPTLTLHHPTKKMYSTVAVCVSFHLLCYERRTKVLYFLLSVVDTIVYYYNFFFCRKKLVTNRTLSDKRDAILSGSNLEGKKLTYLTPQRCSGKSCAAEKDSLPANRLRMEVLFLSYPHLPFFFSFLSFVSTLLIGIPRMTDSQDYRVPTTIATPPATMDENIQLLMELASCDADKAMTYLDVADGDLPTALAMLEAEGPAPAMAAPPPAAAPPGRTDRLSHAVPMEAAPRPSIPRRELPPTVRDGATVRFQSVCEEAARRHLRVLILFHDNSLASYQAQETLWRHPSMDLLNEFVLCYDVNRESDGAVLFRDYQLSAADPLHIIIVNPTTQHKEFEVPVILVPRTGMLDAEDIINNAVYFLAVSAAGPDEPVSAPPPAPWTGTTDIAPVVRKKVPTTTVGKKLLRSSKKTAAEPFTRQAKHFAPTPNPRAKKPQDSLEDNKGVAPMERTAPAPSPAPVSAPPLDSTPVLPTVVSLEPFEVLPSPDAVELRLQFPKGPLDVCLARHTPVSALLGYAAHRLHQENREAYPSPPAAPFFLGGFPPRRLELPEDLTTPLGEWKAVRPKDRLLRCLQPGQRREINCCMNIRQQSTTETAEEPETFCVASVLYRRGERPAVLQYSGENFIFLLRLLLLFSFFLFTYLMLICYCPYYCLPILLLDFGLLHHSTRFYRLKGVSRGIELLRIMDPRDPNGHRTRFHGPTPFALNDEPMEEMPYPALLAASFVIALDQMEQEQGDTVHRPRPRTREAEGDTPLLFTPNPRTNRPPSALSSQQRQRAMREPRQPPISRAPASRVQVDRLLGPSVPTHERREALPPWVRCCTSLTMDRACQQAAEFRVWLVMLIHRTADTAACFWTPRWLEVFRDQALPYDVSLATPEGRLLQHQLGLTEDVPTMLLVYHPTQRYIERNIPVLMSPFFDVDSAYENLWQALHQLPLSQLPMPLPDSASDDDAFETSSLYSVEAPPSPAPTSRHWDPAPQNAPDHFSGTTPPATMDENIPLLMALASCDVDKAMTYLDAADGDLPTALAMLEAEGPAPAMAAPPPAAAPPGRTDRLSHAVPMEAAPRPSIPRRELPPTVRDGATVRFQSVCEEAARRHLRVLILFHDNSLASYQAQETLWRHPSMDLLNEFVLCYDVNRESDGAVLFSDYQLSAADPLHIIIVNPTTQHKEFEVPVVVSSRTFCLDAGESINRAVAFCVESTGADESDTRRSVSTQRSDTRFDAFASLEQGEQHGSPAPVAVSAPPDAELDSTPVLPTVVSLEPFEVLPSPDAVELRLQFPKGPLDVCLARHTPVSALLGYAAHRLHQENREAYPSPPAAPFFLGGFPPRRLELPEDLTTPLGEWKAVRPKDRLLDEMEDACRSCVCVHCGIAAGVMALTFVCSLLTINQSICFHRLGSNFVVSWLKFKYIVDTLFLTIYLALDGEVGA
eukprot:gene895-524_t